MKLFFWKKRKSKTILPQNSEIKDEDLLEEFKKMVNTDISSVEEKKIPEKKYSVLAMKKWCDENLSPLAWARIMLKTFSIIRDAGYDFSEIQNPTRSTVINQNIYLIIRAAMVEIYKQDYKLKAAI